ncbi:hypothetical protein CPHO_03715 [Corynebacterium phocae]|uniref:EcsC family protein n=1 Tax=Corynebacterium phocae TaxID=161895 RepID=A0A1L7D2E5_9CORY|nr:hypothetical protein [Corynebacterium phocae]APT92141.1 hypothetical protein CPHO_03715 [Corynebacterium phocae]KAA8725925.1 hypothetical protein F4V58_03260 [Corynebacterium phocae]
MASTEKDPSNAPDVNPQLAAEPSPDFEGIADKDAQWEEPGEGSEGDPGRDNLAYARTFLQHTLRFKKARIDREQFLRAELRKRGCSDARIAKAISSTPLEAGVSLATLDEIAQDAADFEIKKSSAISLGSGLPGGLALFVSVPADITQQYIFNFRIMQKVAYAYGWQSFLEDSKDVDDETLNTMLMFLSVMLGITGANRALGQFLLNTVGPAVGKKITNTALMKTVWYPVLKRTLRYVGVQITKNSLGKAVTKAIPVAGGVVSGGLTFVSLKQQSARIIEQLRELPPPGMDAEEYTRLKAQAEDFEQDSEEKQSRLVGSVKKASAAIQEGSAGVTDKARGIRNRWSKRSKDHPES